VALIKPLVLVRIGFDDNVKAPCKSIELLLNAVTINDAGPGEVGQEFGRLYIVYVDMLTY
jgi:hypothetical protein